MCPLEELADEVTYQIGALAAFATAAGDRVRYVKPHGALVPPGGGRRRAGRGGHRRRDPRRERPGRPGLRPAARSTGWRSTPACPSWAEAFADRAYNADGTLVSRRRPGAVLTDEATVVDQAVRLAVAGEVVAISGEIVAVAARSLCLHGDTPGAAAMAVAVRRALIAAGVPVAPFA